MIEYRGGDVVRIRRHVISGKGEIYCGGVLLGEVVAADLLEIEKPRGGLTQQSPERRKLSRGIFINRKEDV